jgi:MHS family proline/betaine transporter-like MFS transporter
MLPLPGRTGLARTGEAPYRDRVWNRRRALVGGCLGNAVEWYDFAIYGAFSTVLARVFFPAGEGAALAATFAIFAASFVARLAGAALIGRRSDHFGRRPALSLTIAMMAVATTAVAFLPPWSAIGVLAPVSLLLLRLVQGFSTGGETPSSVAFLVESAPPGQRGRYGGWHTASTAAGLAAGYGVAALFTAVLSPGALADWGWRVAFVFAAPLGLVARYIRLRLAETPSFTEVESPRPPHLIGDVLRGRGAGAGRGFVLIAAFAMAFNVWFVFLPNHLAQSGLVSLGQALAFGVAGLLTAAIAAPLAGRLADRHGRRPLLIAATSAIAAFAVPGFALARGSVIGLLVSDIVMGALIGSLVVTAFVAELFPTGVRATGVALTYGVASAVFGGTAPLIATLLTGAGQTWAVPASLAATALLGLVAAVTARETAFARLS